MNSTAYSSVSWIGGVSSFQGVQERLDLAEQPLRVIDLLARDTEPLELQQLEPRVRDHHGEAAVRAEVLAVAVLGVVTDVEPEPLSETPAIVDARPSRHDISRRQAVGTGDLAAISIPDEQVLIRLIESIQVSGQSRSFASLAERDLTKPSDFRQDSR